MTAPHCDPAILHAPGRCEYCDYYPSWQEYRELAGIAFTGDPDELGVKPVYGAYIDQNTPGKAPCPSTWFRTPAQRDHWGPNNAAWSFNNG